MLSLIELLSLVPIAIAGIIAIFFAGSWKGSQDEKEKQRERDQEVLFDSGLRRDRADSAGDRIAIDYTVDPAGLRKDDGHKRSGDS